ncbi:hypothetical protein FPHYL_8376 [Fusarium phyllophilum]|uniref:Uncharacterized protein n=1 Tax=Fusarium phyllophilum TaxID=47803 RepID=A0A8H5N7F6_9HYPO|nr:hypothetical protein FPHYL_8376 [Fusarium phyllophilum]
MDRTETVDNGQLLSIFVEYQGKTWGEPPRNIDCRLVEQQPLPPHLEIPVKIIEKGLLKAHGLAVPDDGSTVLRYDLRLYELRDREHKVLVRERRYIEQTEQEMRRCWAGNRKLTVLDLAFDLRDYWSDCNVRQKLNELGKRIMRDIDVDEDEEGDV